MSNGEVRLTLRLPADLSAQIHRSADEDARSLNGEIVYALRRYYTEIRAHEMRQRRGKLDQD